MTVQYVEVTVRVFKSNYMEATEIISKPAVGVPFDADVLTDLLTDIEDLVSEDL